MGGHAEECKKCSKAIQPTKSIRFIPLEGQSTCEGWTKRPCILPLWHMNAMSWGLIRDLLQWLLFFHYVIALKTSPLNMCGFQLCCLELSHSGCGPIHMKPQHQSYIHSNYQHFAVPLTTLGFKEFVWLFFGHHEVKSALIEESR